MQQGPAATFLALLIRHPDVVETPAARDLVGVIRALPLEVQTFGLVTVLYGWCLVHRNPNGAFRDPAGALALARTVDDLLRDRAFAETYPALARWGQLVLAHRRRRTPLEIAAAWELAALECERVGALDEADTALAVAHEAARRAG